MYEMTQQPPFASGPLFGAGPDLLSASFNLASLPCSIIWLFELVGEATVSIVGDAVGSVVVGSDVGTKEIDSLNDGRNVGVEFGTSNKLEIL